MKRLSANRFALSHAIIAGLALLCLAIVGIVHFLPGNNIYAYAPYAYKLMTPETRSVEIIPEYGGKRYTYTFIIPNGKIVTHGARLSFYLQHTFAQAWLEDELQLDTGERESWHIGKTPGNVWMTIPMRSENSGKKLTLCLTPVYKDIRWTEPRFLLIEHGDLSNLIIQPQDMPLFVPAIFAAISGFFLAVITLVMRIPSRNKIQLFYLGAMAFCVGLWKIMNLPLTTHFLDIYGLQKELWYLGASAFLMLQLLTMQYILNFINRERENYAHGFRFVLFEILPPVSLLTVLLLQLLNIADFHYTMPWYGVLCIAVQLLFIADSRPAAKELIWLLPFTLTAVLDIFIYYLSGSTCWMICYLIWMVFSLIFRGAGFISDSVAKEHQLYETKTKLQDAQIRGMIQQIRPHFLYNTLTSVYVLCRDDPPRAMEVVQNFTDYLQANFNAIGATELISFSDELRHTKAYLAVESIRFGDKLSVDYDIKHSAFRLPPLSLQPLVENAVKYGVGKGYHPVHIQINTRAEKDCAVLTVQDDGPGFDPKIVDDEAYAGIRNVRSRLTLMCGGSLEIQSSTVGGTTVTVTIPNETARP